MTDDAPEERIPRFNEDEPEVEGHRLHLGPEEPGRLSQVDEGAGEGTDAEQDRIQHRPQH
jgi:hypothetical protein